MGFMLMVLCCCLMDAIFPPHVQSYTLPGSRVRIIKASFLRSCFPEANTRIHFEPNNGKPGDLVLWQDPFDGPITMIPSGNTNLLYCLYDNDVGLHLIILHLNTPFTVVKTNATDSFVPDVLFTSSWDIESWGTVSNWDDVLSYLRTVPPQEFARRALDVGFRSYQDPQTVLAELKHQHFQ